jgi:hypothetical protein
MKNVGKFLDRLIRSIFRIVVYLVAIGLVILGAHGVYTYTSRLEIMFGAQQKELFLTMKVPLKFQGMVGWMSIKGFESWIIPAIFIVGGILLWKFETEIEYFIFRKIPNIIIAK